MQFHPPLIEGRLVRRYKRFLADVVLIGDGREVTAHVANPGAMIGLKEPGSTVFLSISDNPKRLLKHSWEVALAPCGGQPQLVGINTLRPNQLVAEALAEGRLPMLAGYDSVRPEVRYGERSRVDFLLSHPSRPPCYLEVKNSHLMREPGLAEFPDCRTVRAARHMEELAQVVKAGCRAVLLQVIQMEAGAFRVAADYDPLYAAAFARALDEGVEAYAVACEVTREGIAISREVPILRA